MTNASKIAADLRRHTDAGYFVVGAAITTGENGDRLPGTDIRVLGTVDVLTEAVSYIGADTVIVTDGHNLSPARLRELSWSLEPGRQHLVMAPSLTDIAGPRIHARPVAGLPLVHVETPRYEGSDRFLKRAFDVARLRRVAARHVRATAGRRRGGCHHVARWGCSSRTSASASTAGPSRC